MMCIANGLEELWGWGSYGRDLLRYLLAASSAVGA